jgi:hypothetical protein
MPLTQFAERLNGRSEQVEAGYAVEANGLVVLRTLTKAEWEDIGDALARRIGKYQWAIGDWLVYGECWGPYGEKWDQVSSLSGLMPKLLNEYYRCAKAYPLAQRVLGASWSRHHEVLILEADVRLPFIKRAMNEYWNHLRWRAEMIKAAGVRNRGELEALRDVAPGQRVKGRAAKGNFAENSSGRLIRGIKCPFCEHIIPKAMIRTYKAEPTEETA